MQEFRPGTRRRSARLYDRVVDNAAAAIREAVAAVAAVTDPQVRAKAATEVLEALHEANGDLSKLRREDIKKLREAGMSYRQIGAAIGIHFTRVKQLESGAPTGNSAR